MKKQTCQHPALEDVVSRDGKITHGRRCVRCNKQWVVDVCTGCKRGVEHVARSDRKSWTCRKCLASDGGAQ